VPHRLLIVGRRHREGVVRVDTRHHNEHRPHRSLGQQPPLAKLPPMIPERTPIKEPLSLDRLRLGGLLHEYQLAA
jgi:putative transposase